MFLFVYYESVTIGLNQSTTDAFVSDRPKIICRHCINRQTDSLVREFQPHIDSDAIGKWEGATLPIASKSAGGGASALPAP